MFTLNFLKSKSIIIELCLNNIIIRPIVVFVKLKKKNVTSEPYNLNFIPKLKDTTNKRNEF